MNKKCTHGKFLFLVLSITVFFLSRSREVLATTPDDIAVVSSNLPYAPGQLLVRFAPKADGKQRTKAEKENLLASIGGGIVKESYRIVPGLTLVKLPEGKTVENTLDSFKKAQGILYAEPNYRLKALSTFPNDPNFAQLWALHNTGQMHPQDYKYPQDSNGWSSGTPDADIDAPEAWDITTGNSDIIVAVIDTGVDYTHPDLAANIWVNEAEKNGITGVDDDNNSLKFFLIFSCSAKGSLL